MLLSLGVGNTCTLYYLSISKHYSGPCFRRGGGKGNKRTVEKKMNSESAEMIYSQETVEKVNMMDIPSRTSLP